MADDHSSILRLPFHGLIDLFSSPYPSVYWVYWGNSMKHIINLGWHWHVISDAWSQSGETGVFGPRISKLMTRIDRFERTYSHSQICDFPNVFPLIFVAVLVLACFCHLGFLLSLLCRVVAMVFHGFAVLLSFEIIRLGQRQSHLLFSFFEC